MELFNRSVSVLVGPRGKPGRLIQDLRIVFSIDKTLETHPNPAKIEIYNLNEESRSVIEGKDSVIFLSAGYGGQEKGIYQGDVAKVTTSMKGADIVTTIEAGDGEYAYQNSSAELSFAPGASSGAVLDKLMDSFGLSKGEKQGFDPNQQYLNGLTLSGPVRDHLDVVLGKQGVEWSIQDGQVQILHPSKASLKEAVVLNPATGLIGSPFKTKVIRQDLAKPKDGKVARDGVKFISLLNGEITPGRLVQVQAKFVSGVFRVERVTFHGDTHAGPWYAEVEAL